ncbi:MAG: FAD-dependent oxidoreductase [Pseudomonadota bacterium]
MMSGGLVIVGGGMAAVRLVQQLAVHKYSQSVTVISAEPHFGYNRVLLPSLVAGTCRAADLLPSDESLTGLNLQILNGCKVTHIDAHLRRLTLSSSAQVSFDQLVLAPGSSVPVPEIPGANLPGVTQLRSIADAKDILDRCTGSTVAVVVGGGFLGLETADALNLLGLNVHLIHRADRLMNRNVDLTAGEQLQIAVERQGTQVHLNTTVTSIIGHRNVEQVSLADGTVIDTSLVLFTTGAQPRVELAKQAGLILNRGIVVNPQLCSSDPNIYAIGECASLDGIIHQLVEPIHAQADTLASLLCGVHKTLQIPDLNASLKTSHTQLYSAGHIPSHTTEDDWIVIDNESDVYRRLVIEKDILKGAVFLGDISGARNVTSALNTPLSSTQIEQLLFGREPEQSINSAAEAA